MLLVLTMLLGCLTGLLTVSAEDAAAGPVARYTFDEENLDDSSGSNLAATAIGEGLTYTAEEGRGKVLELNNTGKRRDNGNGLRISKAVMDKMSEANAFTVVMDAKIHGIDAGSYPTWLDINAGVGKNEGNDYFLVSLLTFADTPGEFNAQLLADEYGIPRSEAVRIHNGTGSSACIGKWVQLAFLMEGSTAKIYVDGKLAGEGDFKCDVTKLFSGGAAKREMNMTLGTPSCWPDGAMDAALDNVEIYDRALTEAQLKALRPDEGGDQPAEERLPVAYYTFDNGPKPLDDDGTPLLPGKVCQQLVREHDLHIRDVRRHAADELHTLCRGKHGMLVDVEHHADDQPVKALGRALDDVQVPVRHRVKAAGIDRCLHARCAFRKIVTAVLPYL